MNCILYSYLQLPTAMPTCARALLFGAIGGMIFVARGNTYLCFIEWGQIIGLVRSSITVTFIFFLVFVSKVQATK